MQCAKLKTYMETGRVVFLPARSIRPNPAQPRRTFEEGALAELTDSVRQHGVIQPLSVRRVGGGYELIAGERRLRAAQAAGLGEIPCIVMTMDDTESGLVALVENLQRRDLDFWEEALALERLINTFQLSQEECARRIGKSQSAVANKLRLLKLPSAVLELLRDSGCSERHARALLPLELPDLQMHAAKVVVDGQLTVAQTESLVQQLRSPPPNKPAPKRTFVVKDVRLFLNTLNRSMALMKSAGVDAHCQREDREDEIFLTIRIPNFPSKETKPPQKQV